MATVEKSRHPDGGGPDEEKRPYLYHQTLGLGGASATDLFQTGLIRKFI